MENKELKEAVVGLLVLATFIAERAKDGLKLDDAVALVTKFQTDAVFAQALKDAVEGVGKIPEEVKDLDLAKTLDLIVYLVPKILDVVQALSKK